MQKNETAIEYAFRILNAEIAVRGREDVHLKIDESEWVEVVLSGETNNFWIGYKENSGYYVSWNKQDCEYPFFKIDREGVYQFFESTVHHKLIPFPSEDKDSNFEILPDLGTLFDQYGQVPGRMKEKMITKMIREQIESPYPDGAFLERVLEETKYTFEGLDILATVALSKKYKIAVERLKFLLHSQSSQNHPEDVYLKLISKNSWMVGPQYNEVLPKDYIKRFGSGADLIVSSTMGYFDLLVVKRPDSELLKRSSPPETWKISSTLNDILYSAQESLRTIDEQHHDIAEEIVSPNQSVSRNYRSKVIIVMGRTPSEDEALNILKVISSDNSRIVLMTFDDILSVASAAVKSFDKELSPLY